MSVEGSVRERRRAETIKEIKAAALDQLGEIGTVLSLRQVSRTVGMTVQSLYHYFDSRDALLTELVIDGHSELTAAVQDSADASRGRPHAERLFAATNAYRAWALANRTTFLLLYGTPVPGYAAPTIGPVSEASRRLAGPFMDVVFHGWTPEQIAGVPLLPGTDRLAEADFSAAPLPIGALVLFYEQRARMHGLVMLELLGHLVPLGGFAEDIYRSAVSRAIWELDTIRNSTT